MISAPVYEPRGLRFDSQLGVWVFFPKGEIPQLSPGFGLQIPPKCKLHMGAGNVIPSVIEPGEPCLLFDKVLKDYRRSPVLLAGSHPVRGTLALVAHSTTKRCDRYLSKFHPLHHPPQYPNELSWNQCDILGCCFTCKDKKKELGKVEFRGSEPAFAWRESGRSFGGKPPPSSPDRDSNLDLPVLGGLAQHETSALANYATEAEEVYPHLRRRRVENYFRETPLSTPNRDSILDLPVISGLVYCESGA
uniref:Uncharacterized protein n=1 Tax=Timema genevievae TaxID=629358 RepID=A0A7R9PQF6_TIMGE|nr:unnamed protein product [Timema genevievae]